MLKDHISFMGGFIIGENDESQGERTSLNHPTIRIQKPVRHRHNAGIPMRGLHRCAVQQDRGGLAAFAAEK